MSAGNSIHRRIPAELDEMIVDVQKKLDPIAKEITGKEMEYTAAARMVVLKLKKYILPFTNEVYNEMVKIIKENGGKNGRLK